MLLLFLWIATAKLSCDFASMLKLDASAGFYTYNPSLLILGIALYATHTHTTVTMDVVKLMNELLGCCQEQGINVIVTVCHF